ncbi:hypothetical protein DP923_12765 [Pontibacter arcticus]|uniref:Aerotolerance regulator N-terminal domain-containing protein n=2 Tax=Pontibacter arcticus TaxID=2080288 RepID=A0A364RBC4_9BACT|nr:hypothetical protein DP923_12765 [Pontibacter arcticus]
MAFLYPVFLFALAAISVPVVLHLIQLRKTKKIVFSNVKFIQQSKNITASQRNIKEWLILICRILFITFLVLAFSQPFIPANTGLNADTRDVKLVLDTSYSMQQTKADNDLTLLETGKELASSIINLFPSQTYFSVFLNNSVKDQLQKEEAITQIEELSFVGNTFPSFFKNTKPDSHLFFISDFQKSSFKLSSLNSADSSAQIHLVPLESGAKHNIVIDSVFLEDEFLRAEVENKLHILLRNTGNNDVEDIPVKFFIGKEQAAVLSIDIPAQQKKEAVINFRFSKANSQQASISIEDYPVTFDNTYFFNLSPSNPISIVSIEDSRSTALSDLYKTEPLFRFTTYTSEQVDYSQVILADIIILKGVSSLSTGVAAMVANFVKEGGTVVVIPPAGTKAEGYTSFFQNLNIAATLQAANSQSIKTNLLAPDPANIFFKSVFSNFDPKMQMPEAVRSASWSRASEDILKYRGGSAFLSRFDRGNGQVYLMAAPLEQELNSLVNHAFFVPLFYKMALSSYKQEQQLAYMLGLNTISIPVNVSAKKEGIFKIKKDSVEFIPEQQLRGGKLYFTIPEAIEQAGFYTLTHQDSVVSNLAFNYDRAESELAQYTPDELRAMLGEKYKNIQVYDYSDNFTVKGEFEKRYFGVKLWKYCLILCLFFLMAEIALIRIL